MDSCFRGNDQKIECYLQLAVGWIDTNHRYFNNSLDHSHVIAALTANF